MQRFTDTGRAMNSEVANRADKADFHRFATSKVYVPDAGSTRLGTCNTRGEIRLSCVLVLLPSELRDYVILHEFAHLTEMNHSPRFYALLDRYCGGRNAILRRALKNAVLPV